jgi:hypothetical protein
MPRIADALREQVTTRARGLCEYCQSAQIIVVYMEVDHILPEGDGGTTELDNLCLACPGCNGFKLDFRVGIDPDSGEEVELFNPRLQKWRDHFQWDDEGVLLIGLTPVGRATINRLRFNREGILASRRLWVEVGWHPPKERSFPLD